MIQNFVEEHLNLTFLYDFDTCRYHILKLVRRFSEANSDLVFFRIIHLPNKFSYCKSCYDNSIVGKCLDTKLGSSQKFWLLTKSIFNNKELFSLVENALTFTVQSSFLYSFLIQTLLKQNLNSKRIRLDFPNLIRLDPNLDSNLICLLFVMMKIIIHSLSMSICGLSPNVDA